MSFATMSSDGCDWGHLVSRHERIAVIDDDPTGIQTAANVPLVTSWEEQDLSWALDAANPIFAVLTNSRALTEPYAVDVNRTIGARLARLSRERKIQLRVISRSDSTLRGHFPAEVEALIDGLSQQGDRVDGILICPAFPEAGRVTINDIHRVRVGNRWIPAAETEFARDARFGYRSSHLGQWVAERAGIHSTVRSLALADVRAGSEQAADRLVRAFAAARYVVANAETAEDLRCLAEAVSLAERRGLHIVYRTGPSFVSARAGRATAPPLPSVEVGAGPGLLVVGSHTALTTAQLTAARTRHTFATVSLDVEELAALPQDARRRLVQATTRALMRALSAGDAALVTSRRVVPSKDEHTRPALSETHQPTAPASARRIRDTRAQCAAPSTIAADAVVKIVRSTVSRVPPAWIVAKGGITSHDTATLALGARRALVLGQILPGRISIWSLAPESRVPGLPYVVFPGNVGDPNTLADVLDRLKNQA